MNELLQKSIDSIIGIGSDLLVVVLIIIVGKLCLTIVSKLTGNALKKANNLTDQKKAQEIKTNMTITHSANRYLVYMVVIVLCLKQLGFGDQISSAAVAAGVGGLIISLGLQSIIKDMAAGIVLNFEKQYLVGDYVKINDYEGIVTSIALRVTYLESAGRKIIIPNGEIKNVINYSHTNSLAVIKVPSSYQDDTDKVMKVLQDIANTYYKNNKESFIDKKPDVLGISAYNDTNVELQVIFTCKPMKHFQVERDMRLLIKKEFKKKKLSLAYNKLITK